MVTVIRQLLWLRGKCWLPFEKNVWMSSMEYIQSSLSDIMSVIDCFLFIGDTVVVSCTVSNL